ncbi:MAG: hypothetical protein E7575_03290 [Ruminococcaceae bacterium]|nr:hypothetical protein [Oscillospiraceae bacterium]
MKKRSKLFLLISGIIFLSGVILCLVGAGIASASGEQLYSTKKGSDRYYTYSFGDGETDRIKISITDGDINVFGGAEKNYIEIVNFNENNSSYKANSASVTFTETSEIKDITGLWESGIGFKGLRHIIKTQSSKNKAVNIYVTDTELVKSFELKLEKGNIDISGLSTKTNYSISVESGKIHLTDISTDGTLTVNAKGDSSTGIILNSVIAKKAEFNAKRANLIVGGDRAFKTDNCDINIGSGKVDLEFIPYNAFYTVDVAVNRQFFVNGMEHTNTYTFKNVPEDDGKDDKDEEKPKISVMNISGDSLSVTLETPEKEAANDENTTN